MFTGVTALLARSLRSDARSLLNHTSRVGLMVAIYIALVCSLQVAIRFGAPGMRFFKASVYLNVIFMSLLGIGFFSTTISEEKEEETLGLLTMAGISPLGLLLGKLGGRLVQAMLLILVQYPFTLLAVTMGGVTHSQVQAAYISLIGFTLLIAGVGVLCSTLSSSSRAAGTSLVVVLGLYVIIPFVCQALLGRIGLQRSIYAFVLQKTAMMSVFLQIEGILTSGWGDSLWSLQVITNALAGLICFLLAWGCFGVTSISSASEACSTSKARVGTGNRRSIEQRRVWNNPFIWKEYYFVAGGQRMLYLRLAAYAVLFPVTWIACSLWGLRGWGSTPQIGVYLFFSLFALSWETSLVAARCLQDEIRGQTLASLVMLPQSTTQIFYSKLCGALLGILPGIALFLIACFLGFENVTGFLNPRDPGPFILVHLLLVPHLSAVYALWVRWGAVPLAIGTMVGLFAIWIVIGEMVFRFRDAQFNVIAVFLVFVCVGLHFFVNSQIRRIAQRE
ncbi:MAG: hypothetical protein U0941_27845 [Planctomycetaceae bacterium]